MQLLVIGVVGFIAGLACVIGGRALHARELDRRRAALPDEMKGFFAWTLSVVKDAWPVIIGPRSTAGERIAAVGSVLMALSVLAIVGGIVVLVIAGTAGAVSKG
jgi:hypothetical protein